MTQTPDPIDQARALLADTTEARPGAMGTLAAAALAATAAVLMAGVMILGPGVALDQPQAPSDAATF